MLANYSFCWQPLAYGQRTAEVRLQLPFPGKPHPHRSFSIRNARVKNRFDITFVPARFLQADHPYFLKRTLVSTSEVQSP